MVAVLLLLLLGLLLLLLRGRQLRGEVLVVQERGLQDQAGLLPRGGCFSRLGGPGVGWRANTPRRGQRAACPSLRVCVRVYV